MLFSFCMLLNKAVLSRTDQAYCIPCSSKSWKPPTGVWEPLFLPLSSLEEVAFNVANQIPALDAAEERTVSLSLPLSPWSMPFAILTFPFGTTTPQNPSSQITVLLTCLCPMPYVGGSPDVTFHLWVGFYHNRNRDGSNSETEGNGVKTSWASFVLSVVCPWKSFIWTEQWWWVARLLKAQSPPQMALWPKETCRALTQAMRSLGDLAVLCLLGRWSWLLWRAHARGFGFFLSPTAPVAAPSCQQHWRRMEDACRDPGHTQHSPPASGSPVLPGLRVLPLLSLLFALLSVCVSSPAEAAKGLNNRWEETKSLQGIISDATVLMGKIFCIPAPAFAFQGTITQYKVMLFSTFHGAILQQRH